MAAIQGCVPGRAEVPPNMRPLAMDSLFLCLVPHTGFLAGLGGLRFFTLGLSLIGIILLEEAARGSKKSHTITSKLVALCCYKLQFSSGEGATTANVQSKYLSWVFSILLLAEFPMQEHEKVVP